MNKAYLSVLTALVLLTAVGMVSAIPNNYNTVVAGKIYAQNIVTGPTVPGAIVNATCDGNFLNTTSQADGAYAMNFLGGNCTIGSNVIVEASKAGVGSGIINASVNNGTALDLPLNFAVGNIVLVPEFSLAIGLVTVIGALGAFLVIRRK